MSVFPQQSKEMSESEYLAFERAGTIKHEYINGEVFAMTGASWEHNLICSMVITSLVNQLRGKNCRVCASEMRVKVESTGLYTYPDVSVVCAEPQFVDDEFDTLVNPILIVEVLSKSTEAYDRGEKFHNYRRLSSLQEYVLISQYKPRIESYFRQPDGIWGLRDAASLDASLNLASIDCVLSLAEIYEGITFKSDADKASD